MREIKMCNPPMTLEYFFFKALKIQICSHIKRYQHHLLACLPACILSDHVFSFASTTSQAAYVVLDRALNVRDLVVLRCVDSRTRSDHGTHQRRGAEPCNDVACQEAL